MPHKSLLAGAVSILGTLAVSAPAFAGNCAPGLNCAPQVKIINDYAPKFGPMTVRNTPPMGHFRSIDFQRAPNVSITRVHGMAPMADLSDAPSGFTGGCHPTSTTYCRSNPNAHAPVPMPAPQPIFQAPAPVIAAAPAPQKLRTWIGGGYDPSKFTPRQYGENTFTPGIAYIPTSRVVRDPAAADAMLNSGKTVAQPIANGGVAPRPAMVQSQTMSSQTVSYGAMPPATLSGPAIAMGAAPKTIVRHTPFPTMAGAPTHVGNNTYVSDVGADGTYWEKTSGMTAFGNTIATKVICKRKVEQRVVNPVIGIPQPIPTPVPVPGCAVAPTPHAHGPHGHMGGPKPSTVTGPYPRVPGPWVY